MAPVVMVNDTVYQRVKPTRVGDLINEITALDAAETAKELA